ncbi:MAG: murein biosynthesis integral membrane protein MurJ [Desulfosalsimonadaceae bacterium]
MNENRKVTRAAGIIGISTLASRILGFVRDMILAWFFGAGKLSDAFFVAFRIPNLLRRLLAEGTLTMAFVPVFAEYLEKKGRNEAFAMARSAMRMLSVVLAIITVSGVFGAPLLVYIFAPGFSGETYDITVLLTRIMFPYIFFICLVALAMGILNTMGHFAAPAFAPVLLNVGIIIGALAIAPMMSAPVHGLAAGVLLGGILQLALQVPFLAKKGFRFWEYAPLYHPGIKKIAILMGPAVFGAAVYQINILVGTMLASLLPEGSVSYLYYADRLVQFPLGIFAISTSVAILPSLSRQAAAKDLIALENTFSFAMRFVFFITIPSTIGLIVLKEPIIALLFGRGEFDAASIHMTAYALLYYAAGLCAFSAVRIVVATFYALQDTKTPVKMATISIMANILLGIALMGPMKHGGLALATSLASMINLVLLTRALKNRIGGLAWKNIVVTAARSVLSSIIMGIILLYVLRRFPPDYQGASLSLLFYVVSAIMAGTVIYMGISLVLQKNEMKAVASMVKRP